MLPTPILKWAGSKRALAETIRRAFDAPATAYAEPFVGGGSVYLHRVGIGDVKPGPHVLLADLNPHLLALYRCLQADAESVVTALGLGGLCWERGWRDQYNDRRALFNLWMPGPEDTASPGEASLMLWINRACFNGLYRRSQSGKFNAPAGSYDKPARPSPASLLTFGAALQGVRLKCADYRETLAECQEGTQVYLDPPYYETFDGYGGAKWGYREHVQLALACQVARDGSRCHVVASNADHPQIRALYQGLGFDVREATSYHAIGATGERRTHAAELVMVGTPARKPKARP